MSLVFSALAKVGLTDKNWLLHRAAKKGYTSMAGAAIESGANVHSSYEGALRLSILGRHLETTRLLLEKGADPHANNGEPLYMAKKTGNIEIQNLLRNYPKRAPL